MQEKKCSKCEKILPASSFYYRDKQKGTQCSVCKKCHNEYVSSRNAENRAVIQEKKKASKCAKCGEERWYLLDYHHVDPSKKDDTVARLMVHASLDAAQHEIEKCVSLCSNCHREFHFLEKEQGVTLEEYLQNP